MEQLVQRAVGHRATDIHLEPVGDELRIRLRVDGGLVLLTSLPASEGKKMCSRIKVRAGMDIAQRMLPQDGSMRVTCSGQNWDIRVAAQPTILGEKLVLRLLPTLPLEKELEALGMMPEIREAFSRLFGKGQGLVLVTGPTGSGKTTTLYTALNLLDRNSLNIMTLEDPVEYRLGEIIQTQVNYRGGLDFAAGLRGALRQDPDVMLVGEIRDGETAGISLRAALTGHLVLATMHTVDSRSAVARLLDMGCPRYQVAGALAGVLAQRLVRVPCVCGEGCSRCFGSGYFGRTGVFELLRVSASLREAILTGNPLPRPSFTMLDDCRGKLAAGLTDLAQLNRLALALEDEA